MPLSWLYFRMPAAKPFMKIVTVGKKTPPYVATFPVFVIPAAR